MTYFSRFWSPDWSKFKILQVSPSTPCPSIQVADGQVEVVDSAWWITLVSAEASPATDRHCSILHELVGKKK